MSRKSQRILKSDICGNQVRQLPATQSNVSLKMRVERKFHQLLSYPRIIYFIWSLNCVVIRQNVEGSVSYQDCCLKLIVGSDNSLLFC